ncbi:MAG: TetR/AcrR family transcriptional regulator [Bacillota bacterium]|jgi:AcrR family transcriptional regulator
MGDSNETKEKIITSALKLFAKKGYNGTTTSEIAKDSGVSEGTIFKYYQTKKNLLDCVLQKIINTILPGIIFSNNLDFSQFNNPQRTQQYLKEVLIHKISQIKENFSAVRVLVSELQYHEDLKKNYVNQLISGVFNMIESYYEQGVQEGAFRKIDSHIAARSCWGAIAAMVLENVVMKKNIDFDKELNVIFDLFYYGFGTRKEG